MKDKYVDTIYNFGRDVVIQARDMTIMNILRRVNCERKSSTDDPLYQKEENFYKELANLPEKQKEFIRIMIIESIDGAVNNFLWMLEQYNDNYALIAKNENGEQFDIEQESDGLCYGHWVFIDEFSKYNRIDGILETGKLEKEDPAK